MGMREISNIYRLGVKELFSLRRDVVLMALIVADIAFADPGLHHRGGINVKLYFRVAPGNDIGLETRGDHQYKGKRAAIHRGIDIAFGDGFRGLEIGIKQRIGNPQRKRRAILIGNRDRGVSQIMGKTGRGVIDRKGKRPDDQGH